MGLECELKTFSESLYIIYYIILLLPQQTPGRCQNVLRQRGRTNPGGGKLEGLQPGQGWDAPAARRGTQGLSWTVFCRAVGTGILNHWSHGQGPANHRGPWPSRAARARLCRRSHLEWNSSKSFLWVIIKMCYHIINTKQWQRYPFH